MVGTGTSIASIVVVGFGAPAGSGAGSGPCQDVVEVVQRFRPLSCGPHGSAVKLTFASASPALEAAGAVQRMPQHRARARIGISAGDVTWNDGDCEGSPLDVATALQQRADVGGILVSAVVRLLLDHGRWTLRAGGRVEVAGTAVEVFTAVWDGDGAEVGATLRRPGVWLADGPDHLTGREAEVMRLVATGLDNRAIGARLFISHHTVANHIRAILTKTGCANRTQATMYALRNGILDDP